MTILTRLTRLEDARTHRRRLRVAAVLAPLERISAEEAYARTAVAPDDQAAVLARFGNGLVDVADLVRFLARRSGLTDVETVEAIATAERVAALLEARDGAGPWR